MTNSLVNKVFHLRKISNIIRCTTLVYVESKFLLRITVMLFKIGIYLLKHSLRRFFTIISNETNYDKLIITKTAAHITFTSCPVNYCSQGLNSLISALTAVSSINLIKSNHINSHNQDVMGYRLTSLNHRLSMLYKTFIVKHICKTILNWAV